MRSPPILLLPASLLVGLTNALQLPDLRPFTSAIADIFYDALPDNFDNSTRHDLLKRQYSNTCPEQYDSCANLGAPQLCCISNAVCSADQAGAVACCPSGAVCTGTITGYIQSGTVNSNGQLIGGAAVTTTGNGGLVGGTASTTSFQFYTTSTTANNGLVQATQPATVGTDSGTGTQGIFDAGSTLVASPAAGTRRAEIVSGIQAVCTIKR